METYSIREIGGVNGTVGFVVYEKVTSASMAKGRKTGRISSTIVELFTICSVNTMYSCLPQGVMAKL